LSKLSKYSVILDGKDVEIKRKEIREYFLNTFTLFEKVFEVLKDDTSNYVQKSVANNLNDISKDNPNIVIELTKEWINATKTRDWILKHGCRTLLKESNSELLALFGFKTPTSVSLEDFKCEKKVKLHENLDFSFTLLSQKNLAKLRIEFAILFLRKHGQHNKKVFKIAEGTYLQTEKSFHKSYSFKKISTRVYYKGLHKLQIIVNGTLFKEVDFMLT
jgi:hypothetical protein